MMMWAQDTKSYEGATWEVGREGRQVVSAVGGCVQHGACVASWRTPMMQRQGDNSFDSEWLLLLGSRTGTWVGAEQYAQDTRITA
jgi:hypothetical protein